MNSQDFTTAFSVDQTPQEAFDAINDVRAWWKQDITGNSQNFNDEFVARFGDIHYSKHKVTELIPGKRVVWLITDSRLTFIKDESEWIGHQIIFDITEEDGKTNVRFTQLGLVPEIECYKNCSNAWGGYVNNSLRDLITTGNGQPTP